MSWFSKKEAQTSKNSMQELPQLEELPDLPTLPELPSMDKTYYKDKQEKLQPLPTFPSNSFGNQFSQSAIKDAITEDEEEFPLSNQKLIKPLAKDWEEDERNDEEIPYHFKEAAKKVKKAEPIFVRLDKFEDSLQTFEEIKEKVNEIKDVLKNIKEKKSQEEQELAKWESQLKEVKIQIEKIDDEIFSKIE